MREKIKQGEQNNEVTIRTTFSLKISNVQQWSENMNLGLPDGLVDEFKEK